MIGGGNWKKQNKILNGSYINFVSKGKTETKRVLKDNNTNNDNTEGNEPTRPVKLAEPIIRLEVTT